MPSPREEAEQILNLARGDALRAYEMVTVTGFALYCFAIAQLLLAARP